MSNSLGTSLKTVELKVFKMVLLFSIVGDILLYSVHSLKGTISPIGSYGLPLLIVCLTFSYIGLNKRPEKLTFFVIFAYSATSIYLQSVFFNSLFSSKGSVLTLATALQYFPLMYIASYFCSRKHHVLAGGLNYLVFLMVFLIGYTYIEDDTKKSMMLTACVSHPLYLAIIYAFGKLKSHVDYLEEKEGFLKLKATTDGLTGVLNKTAINEFFKEEDASEKRLENYFLVVDADHFKKINDTYGHLKGDEILQKMAKVIKSNVRPGDIVGRWGGEEFFVSLCDVTEEETKVIASRLLEEIRKIEVTPFNYLTASVGVAKKQVNEPCEKTFERADKAVYEAKTRGRNQVIWSL